MAGKRTVAIWGGALAFGLALLGLGIYFFQLGLNRAVAVATILGAFSGLIGIAVAVLPLVAARKTPPGRGSGPQFTGSRIGTYIDFRNVHNVRKNDDRE
jgi:hypothetical protein